MTKKKLHDHTKGFIYAIFAAFFYTLMATFVKFADEVPNAMIVFFRCLVTLLLIIPLLLKKRLRLRTKKPFLYCIRTLTGILALYCYFYAVKHLLLANAILLANTIPLFIPLIVFIWLRIKIPMRRVFAVVIGFIGIVFVLKPGSPGSFAHPAVFVGLGAGCFAAIALVSLRQLTKYDPTETLLFYFFVGTTILSAIPLIWSWEPITNGWMWLYLLLVGVSGALYQYFITKSYTHAPATKASSFMYLSVVFGGIFGWLIWDHIPDVWMIIGAVLVIAGGLIALLDKSDPVRMGK